MRLDTYLKEERSKARKLAQIYLSSRNLEEKLDAATALIVNLTGLLTNDSGLVSLSSRIAKGARRE
jgi:hypothetical protein